MGYPARMQSLRIVYLSTHLAVCATAVACGGADAATPAAKAADTPGGPTPSSETSSSNSSPPVDHGSPTTTSTSLGDGGDLQGAKLQETHTVAATSGSSATSPGKGPHPHDPGRGPADIRAIVMAHRDEARACYDKALAGHPGMEGDLVIQWTIDPKGNVTQVSLDSARSQITDPGVIGCVGDVIRKIQFAASPGGYETKAFYPYNFHPRNARPVADGGT
jgi:hypothetical protein